LTAVRLTDELFELLLGDSSDVLDAFLAFEELISLLSFEERA